MGQILSSLFGGGKTTQTSTTQPWSAQQPYLTDLFANAQNIYNQRSAAGPYTGSFYSPQNGTQFGAETQGANYAFGQGQGLVNQTGATAGGLLGYAPQFGQNAEALATGGASGPGLSGALNEAANAGVRTLGQVAANGISDPTQRIAGDAGAYMSSAPVQSAIDATNANIARTLNQQTLPGINRQAAMGGTLNSSRAGAANAQAQGDAGIAEGMADASIQNNAYNQGLGTAAGLYESGNNTALSAGSSALGANLGVANLNASTELGANAQLGTGLGLGFGGASTTGNLAQGNFTLGSAAGGAQQQDANNQLANLYQQWQQQNNYGQNILSQYGGDISGNYGGSTTGSVQQPMNIAGGILGIGAAVGSPIMGNQSGGWFGPNSIYGGAKGLFQ